MSNMIKKGARRKANRAKNQSNAVSAMTNRAGGVAFEVKDSSLKLVTMTGGAFFAEPRFYNAEACVSSRNSNGKLSKLAERLRLVNDKVSGFESCDELNDTAREVIATAVDVAASENPEDLLIIANWLRNEMNIRLTPQVLLVLASRFDNTKGMVRRYATHIVKRPDEIKTCLMVHRFLFGMKSLSNSLNVGLGSALSRFGERGLMKYDGQEWPRWKDVLCWIKRKKGCPLSSGVAKYFISGEIEDESEVPIIAARKKLLAKSSFDDEAKVLAKQSMVNWEVLLSQFGDTKKSVWKFLIREKLLGYMALLRNLRNILEAKLPKTVIEMVSRRISDPDEVARSKQLPFRFLSALRALQNMDLNCDVGDLNEISAAIELASNAACRNLPVLPGVTAIFADNSASMHTPVSGESQITCMDAANVLCGIVAKISEQPYVFAFGTDVGAVRFTKNDTVLGIADKVADTPIGGYSTNGYKCLEWLMKNGIEPDRVIFLSDMQMYVSHSVYGGYGTSFDQTWQKYRMNGGKCAETWMHSVHLNGYGDNVVGDGERVNQVSGFSEKVFSMLMETEGLSSPEALPTVEQIRQQWSIPQ